MRIRFLTSTPLDIRRGSGTYVGIHVLARALEQLGHRVEYETPRIELPVYTAQRLLFNRRLRPSRDFDLTVGFDMDGYRIAGQPGHIASLKGVIADEVRFEAGLTRFTMGIQARCERQHVQRAVRVLATSRYSAERAREFYGLKDAPVVVPELIDLEEWRKAAGQRGGAGREAYPTVCRQALPAEARGCAAAGGGDPARAHPGCGSSATGRAQRTCSGSPVS